ncbi:MAG: 4-(cytidine 5'-diphospho)-2-C-methyl-D-erythritol kinase [Clostridia bacterium]|nr:4-(cytidine 5'-diphospho)-2-C-methyl-D-erythritol kinase [Clostridia bacterium]
MYTLELKAWAKINLALEVLGRQADGRHSLETVMHRVEIADDVTIIRRTGAPPAISGPGLAAGRILTITDSTQAPGGAANTASRAAAAFLDAIDSARIRRGDSVEIRIRKRIPVAAGLGGGSADAAAVLVGMNQLWGAPLSMERLLVVGGVIGADVPFCILSHGDPPQAYAAFATGVGDTLTPIPGLPGVAVVLAKPSKGLETREIYATWDEMQNQGEMRDRAAPIHERSVSGFARLLAEVLLGASTENKLARACLFMRNDLEPPAVAACPEVTLIKAKLAELGAMATAMSGSGPTVFGVFGAEDEALHVADCLGRWGSAAGLSVIVTHAGIAPESGNIE